MGTPDFAVPCLEALVAAGHEVAAVYSQPDKPKGRGHSLTAPPVKQCALGLGLPVLQPLALRTDEAAEQLALLEPELIVVVAYGRILPMRILAMPKYGCVNVHASLLPRWRGAAPIQWSIIAGDATTGVCTMHMAEGIDTGDVILRRETDILPDETAGALFERLAPMGAELLVETVALLAQGNAPRTPQDDSHATHAPMLDKQIALLDFTKPANVLCNLVRGLNPAPMAYTTLGGEQIKVLAAAPYPDLRGEAGMLLSRKALALGCGDGAVELVTVQPPGKKPMSGAAFINGRRLELGMKFGVAVDA